MTKIKEQHKSPETNTNLTRISYSTDKGFKLTMMCDEHRRKMYIQNENFIKEMENNKKF